LADFVGILPLNGRGKQANKEKDAEHRQYQGLISAADVRYLNQHITDEKAEIAKST